MALEFAGIDAQVLTGMEPTHAESTSDSTAARSEDKCPIVGPTPAIENYKPNCRFGSECAVRRRSAFPSCRPKAVIPLPAQNRRALRAYSKIDRRSNDIGVPIFILSGAPVLSGPSANFQV
jgi:hypothetical protein